MDSDFMNDVSGLLVREGVTVARFEFPYMAQRRETGKKRPPDRAPVLLECFRDAASEQTDRLPLFIGGKSMGGRMATMVANEVSPAGVVCLGYPFHPPGRPEKTRTEHLADMTTPTLICQGERDSFGTHEEVTSYRLSEQIAFHWAPDGNHDLTPRKKSGHTREENLEGVVQAIANFMRVCISGK